MFRYKTIPISPITFANILRGGTFEVHNGDLPKDFKVVNTYLDYSSNCFKIVIESKEFPEVLEGAGIPSFEGEVLIKKIN